MPVQFRTGCSLRLLGMALVACTALALYTSPDGRICAAQGQYSTLFSLGGAIERGDRGDTVTALQEVLSALGYRASADGVFGPETEVAVEAFQSDRNLRPDGVAGPATLRALSRAYDRAYPPETHRVQAGETLLAIAERYGTDPVALARINDLDDMDFISEGQVLALREVPDDVGSVGPNEDTPPGDEPAPLPEPPAVPVAPATRRTCLTFDDGPDISTTRPILSILNTYGVKATFFVIGAEAAKNPDLVREIAAAGHVIGIHGYDHKVLSGLSASEVKKDLVKAQEAIAAITGQKPWLYRPPAGILDQTQRSEAARLGLTTLMWTNIGGADLGASSADEVVARITSGAKDGGVILMHEGLQHTVEALPSVIEALARMGFGFQNVAQP